MRGKIKNRQIVSEIMTQSRMGGKNIDKHFEHKVASRYLYDNEKALTVRTQNRNDPQAQFSRVQLAENAFVWVPTNPAGEVYIAGLSVEERDKFLYHSPPKPVAPEQPPESRRVVDGRPIKGLPNGHREADYFPSDGSLQPRAHRTNRYVEFERDVVITPEEMDKIRARISAGSP